MQVREAVKNRRKYYLRSLEVATKAAFFAAEEADVSAGVAGVPKRGRPKKGTGIPTVYRLIAGARGALAAAGGSAAGGAAAAGTGATRASSASTGEARPRTSGASAAATAAAAAAEARAAGPPSPGLDALAAAAAGRLDPN